MKLVLVRHGQSIYNLENKFTGWKDVDLTNNGIEEAINAGRILKNENIPLGYAYTSTLKRAQKTLFLILKEMNMEIETEYNKALNERDYGDLVGQNKKDASEKFGNKQVQIWRRSYDTPPPGGESLEMTCQRTIPYFKKILNNLIKGKQNIIISAHGNSIRAIVMYLFKYTPELILQTEIGWCEPWVFTFNDDLTLKDFRILDTNKTTNSNLPVYPKFERNH